MAEKVTVNVNQVHAADDINGGNPFMLSTRSINSIKLGMVTEKQD